MPNYLQSISKDFHYVIILIVQENEKKNMFHFGKISIENEKPVVELFMRNNTLVSNTVLWTF